MQLTYRGPDAFADLKSLPPRLLVVVDTEEEFDWDKPFDRTARGVTSIAANERVHGIYDRFGVQPTYCVDQCIAEDPKAVDFLSALQSAGKCRIGTHLHPWVTPPYDEEVTSVNSFHGNLPVDLERAKIRTVTKTIEDAFGSRPKAFKAGRYGLGPNTVGLLKDSGYEIDCSFVPHTDFRPIGGPSYLGLQDQPFWLDADRTLLEVPLTKGFAGILAGPAASTLAGVFDSPASLRWKVPGILARLGLAERITLSPEGMCERDQVRLIRAMVARGKRVFSLTYHSPSLAPGNTPYVRDDGELDRFLTRIERVLTLFRDEIGGGFTSLEELRAHFRPTGTG